MTWKVNTELTVGANLPALHPSTLYSDVCVEDFCELIPGKKVDQLLSLVIGQEYVLLKLTQFTTGIKSASGL